MAVFVMCFVGVIAAHNSKPSCKIAPYSTYGYCNQSWTAGDRAQDLVSRMNLTEKSLSINQNNQGVPRLGVPQFRFGEALHGVMSECGNKTYFKEFGGNNTGCATSFPHALMMGCAFNRSLWSAVGSTVSTESRALANQGLAGLAFWTPDINLARDPRWGRSQEVPSEDPFLNGEYGSSFVNAFQFGTPQESKKYLKAVATAKHFQDYNCETCWGCDQPLAINGSCDRGAFNAKITPQDQVEYFWPAWESTVRDGQVRSVMCSYNAVNGIPSCGNPQMNTILRDKWGFKGFITSDCSAINDPFFNNYVKTKFNNSKPMQASIAMKAGCDFNCGQFYSSYLVDSVKEGFISIADVDEAITRVWEQAFLLGLMDEDVPYHNYGPEKVDNPEHRRLALSASEQSMVLVRNSVVGKNPILPLSESEFLLNTSGSKSIALIGPHFNVTQEMLSIYHGPARCNKIVNKMSPLMIFSNNGINIKYASGCVGTDGQDPSADTSCLTKSGFEKAIQIASEVDIPIVFLGLTPGVMNNVTSEAHESEGWDRHEITLPGYQEDLLKEIFKVNKNTVVVLIHGLQLSSTWMYKNIPAVLDAHYPGEVGGLAIYNAIFGKYSPAGRLSTTTYPESFVSTRNISNLNMRNARGITYRYYLDEPIVPFGFGLSYTTFKFENEAIENESNKRFQISNFTTATYRIKVTNTGHVQSDVSVLGFSGSSDRSQEGHDDAIPNSQLFDFDRIFLTPGESKTVLLTVAISSLAITDTLGRQRLLPGNFSLTFGVNGSSEGTPVTANLILEGEPRTLFSF